MLFKLIGIGDTTAKGNCTVRMQRTATVDTDLGQVPGGRTSRIVVKADTLTKAIGDEVELDLDSTFEFKSEPYDVPVDATLKDGSAHPEAGNTVTMEWIRQR